MRALPQRMSHVQPHHPAWRSPLSDEPPPVYSVPVAQILLPEQVDPASSIVTKHGGIVALMYAVLEDAVECFWKQFGSTRRRDLRLAQEAEEWFWSEGDASPFSFVTICGVLGLDAGYIRRGLKRQRQEVGGPRRWMMRRPVQRRQPLRLAS